MVEQLAVDVVRDRLNNTLIGQELHYYDEVDSTNRILKELAATDVAAGTVVVTDFQSQGRGRQGRQWLAPPGSSLLFSILVRPDWPASRVSWLMMVAGLAAAESIEAVTDLPCRLKWPNDIVLRDSVVLQRQSEGGGGPDNRSLSKLGGILIEGEFENGRLATGIVGIGLNINIPAEQLPFGRIPASSLSLELGEQVSRPLLLQKCLERFEKHYLRIEAGSSPQPAWRKKLTTLGRPVTINLPDSQVYVDGLAEACDEWGRLLVRDSAGVLHVVAAGDVVLHG